ncbi:MAG: radical SAM protein [bacterium]
MKKPELLLLQPAQDKDRLGSRRRRKSSIPKLNLPILAARAGPEFDVKIIDEAVDDIDFSHRPDLVGISVITQTAPRAYEIGDIYRKMKVPVVVGGFHASFFPDEALEHADAVVMGEGEYAWDELLEDFLAGRMKERYQSDKPHNLVGLPRPRLELMRRSAYGLPNVIETARGCPHACSYCAVSLFWGRRFRFRPVEEVVDEIKAMPPGELAFVDDNIAGSHKRAKKLFEALIPLKRRWSSQSDIRIGEDPELLDLAARSGCKWLFIGIESIKPENLAKVGKSKVNVVEKYRESIARIQKAGIRVFGSFILGFDDDDESVFENTVKFCRETRMEAANFYIYTPLPFTQLYRDMEEQNRILHRDWGKYDCNHVVHQPGGMSAEELLEGYLKTYKAMYSPRSILKRAARPRKGALEILAFNLARMIGYKRFEEGCRM